jgi:hypothetical protein
MRGPHFPRVPDGTILRRRALPGRLSRRSAQLRPCTRSRPPPSLCPPSVSVLRPPAAPRRSPSTPPSRNALRSTPGSTPLRPSQPGPHHDDVHPLFGALRMLRLDFWHGASPSAVWGRRRTQPRSIVGVRVACRLRKGRRIPHSDQFRELPLDKVSRNPLLVGSVNKSPLQ